LPKKKKAKKSKRTFEEEFEKLYKKDIDKFIDGSDFEVESLAGFSEISKGTFKTVNHPKLKDLEKVYLQRIEFQNMQPEAKKKMPVRPMMDRFIDDPRELHKGEVTRFQTGPATKESPRLRGDRSVSPRVTDPSPT
jgi:hypothetical protein